MAEFTKTYTFNCPYCGDAKIIKNNKQAGKQRYRCKAFSKQFNDTGAVNGYRVLADHIGATIGMYHRGMSYKQIGEHMAGAYDMDEPHKRAIFEWVKDYNEVAADAMRDYTAHTSGK